MVSAPSDSAHRRVAFQLTRPSSAWQRWRARSKIKCAALATGQAILSPNSPRPRGAYVDLQVSERVLPQFHPPPPFGLGVFQRRLPLLRPEETGDVGVEPVEHRVQPAAHAGQKRRGCRG
eukprot:scaffold1772_cov112-Isochrysis_galbana.AAC.3